MSHLMLAALCILVGYAWGRADLLDKLEAAEGRLRRESGTTGRRVVQGPGRRQAALYVVAQAPNDSPPDAA